MWNCVCAVLGGLALFFFGMEQLTTGMFQLSGTRIQRLLQRVERPWCCVLTGAAATAVLQSSSAVTVLIVGMVSARWLTLHQAIAVVLGANVGTTITAQLTASPASGTVWLLLAAGFLLSLPKRSNAVGTAAVGLGLLLLGIETMQSAMQPLAAGDTLSGMLRCAGEQPWFGVTIGVFLTMMIQSSSASIALLQRVAQTMQLSLLQTLPIVMGSNVGTTITAVLAAARQSTEAKRVVMAHVLFNVSGTVAGMVFRVPFAALVLTVFPHAGIARQIADVHFLFNLGSVLLWMPLLGPLQRIVTWCVPERKPWIFHSRERRISHDLYEPDQKGDADCVSRP